MNCRFCNYPLHYKFVDLVNAPPSNAFLTQDQLNHPEIFFPLKLFVCEHCYLVQIDEYQKSKDIFNSEYIYFSSYSSIWLDHAKRYVDMICQKLGLNKRSKVIEIASNDGYLLQYFKAKDIPCLGIEPTASTANIARKKGINVLEDFFGVRLSKMLEPADLVLGNNVLAHVPDINDFVQGLKIVLKPKGTITMEFPHLLNLIEQNQFDTIYHEHFSYFSFYTVKRIFEKHGLKLYDLEKLSTHGGSLRIYATHRENEMIQISKNVNDLLIEEKEFGLLNMDIYKKFQEKADSVKYELLEFLLKAKKENKKVVAYGAAAKGNTLLNYAGVKQDMIAFVVDKSPHKQGKYLPASHIPILSESHMSKEKPHYILILPWNLKDEVVEQLQYVVKWGCSFVVAVPKLKIL